METVVDTKPGLGDIWETAFQESAIGTKGLPELALEFCFSFLY